MYVACVRARRTGVLTASQRERFAQLGDSIKSTAGKLGRVASSNGFRSQMKMVAIFVGTVVGLYLLWGFFS